MIDTAESWMRRIEALGHVAKAMPSGDESDEAFYARIEAAKRLPLRRRELDPAVEADAARMDQMIEAELTHVERRMLADLLDTGASPEWADENIRAAIPLFRAARYAWRDGILKRMRRFR